MGPDLSIIILNWNSVRYLDECLRSVYQETRNINFEVIVVDGASFDGSEQLVRDKFPEASFVQLTENRGFARGNNAGVGQARAKTLLFLNPDTVVLNGALEKLYAAFNKVPEIGVAGLVLLNSDLSIQTAAVQRYPCILGQILDFDPLINKFKNFPLWGNKALYGDAPTQVEVISGACLMVRKDIFEQVGGFNESYFMYAEDAHLCWNVRQAGREVYLLPVGRVIHHGGGCSAERKVSGFSAKTFRHSIYLFLRQTRGRAYAEVYRYSLGACALARLAILYPIALLKGPSVRNSIDKWRHVLEWARSCAPA
jgi:GT2 family glycosyltransferase